MHVRVLSCFADLRNSLSVVGLALLFRAYFLQFFSGLVFVRLFASISEANGWLIYHHFFAIVLSFRRDVNGPWPIIMIGPHSLSHFLSVPYLELLDHILHSPDISHRFPSGLILRIPLPLNLIESLI